MTEQEKQAIREHVNELIPFSSRENKLKEYVNTLLDSLDERDRECERLNRQLGLCNVNDRRLRKALEQIGAWGPIGGSYSDLVAASTFQRIARKALAGEETE